MISNLLDNPYSLLCFVLVAGASYLICHKSKTGLNGINSASQLCFHASFLGSLAFLSVSLSAMESPQQLGLDFGSIIAFMFYASLQRVAVLAFGSARS